MHSEDKTVMNEHICIVLNKTNFFRNSSNRQNYSHGGRLIRILVFDRKLKDIEHSNSTI